MPDVQYEEASPDLIPLEKYLWSESKGLSEDQIQQAWKVGEMMRRDMEEHGEHRTHAREDIEDAAVWASQLDKQWKLRFVLAMKQTGSGSYARSKARVSGWTIGEAMEGDAVFRKLVNEAKGESVDRIEAANYISGTVGDLEPIVQGGVTVAFKRRKSDKAMELRLKAEMPNKYRPESAQVSVQIDLPPQQLIGDAMKRLSVAAQVVELEDVKQSGD